MKQLFLFFFILQSASAADFYKYTEATQVPEPMFYDLVRSLHSKRGEFEANTLFYQSGDPRLRALHVAPEIEWVPRDNWGLEFELPASLAKVEAYKIAVQHGLERNRKSLIDGWQLIAEKSADKGAIDATLTYLVGKRFKNKFSIFSILGGRHNGDNGKWDEIVNFSVFYDVLDRVDFGVEANLESRHLRSEFLQILPQIHLAMDEHTKIQMGTGVQYLNHQWFTTGALRLIREWNL